MKTLTQTLKSYVAACFSGLWIESQEPDEAIMEIRKLCRDENWNLATWDIDTGMKIGEEHLPDPLSAVRAASRAGDGEKPTLIVLRNFHRFLGSIEIVQAMERQIQNGKQTRIFLLVLSPISRSPKRRSISFPLRKRPRSPSGAYGAGLPAAASMRLDPGSIGIAKRRNTSMAPLAESFPRTHGRTRSPVRSCPECNY